MVDTAWFAQRANIVLEGMKKREREREREREIIYLGSVWWMGGDVSGFGDANSKWL